MGITSGSNTTLVINFFVCIHDVDKEKGKREVLKSSNCFEKLWNILKIQSEGYQLGSGMFIWKVIFFVDFGTLKNVKKRSFSAPNRKLR